MTHEDSPDSAVDARDEAVKAECVRRSVLRGAVVLGAVGIGGALSRFGAGSSSAASLANASGSTPGSGAAAAPASGVTKIGASTAAAPASAGAGLKKGRLLGPASKIPVGGGAIFEAAQVVVTQPTAGVYKAFDANCTHEKCLLADVEGGTINCACHGGKFSITDGSAVKIPPIEPLPAKTVTVDGGKLFVT